MFVYALTIFTGAFLLFDVQPLIGKYILPWFGGATGVWTTCMLFFQMLLLGGYTYAHFTSRWLRPRYQAVLHLALVAVALALLPITPGDSWKPHGGGNPTLQILALLTVSLGLPYFVLSATGPLLQHWFSRTNPGTSPYRLYALSNAGSLLALVSFPVFFETHFTRQTQATLWGWMLAVYAVSCALCALKLWNAKGAEIRATSGEEERQSASLDLQPSTLDKFMWLMLPACASVLLLATTNKICQEVAVIPFLWVLPLGLYLLSFIICFDNPRWYARRPFLLALLASWGGMAWALFKGTALSIELQLALYSAGLFICCMVCHGELYRLRPVPRQLTGFYLMIAAGGALGGLFVAVIAPLIFADYFEWQWGLLSCGLLLLIVCLRDRSSGGFKRWRRPACVCLSAGLVVFGAGLWRQAHQSGSLVIYQSRNFYGVLKIIRHDHQAPESRYLELAHGRTLHGLQFMDPPRSAWPTLYYSEKSGIGLAMQALSGGSRRFGLVGLGTGTLASYARSGDFVHIYEINPEVQKLANTWFTYLTNCPGRVEITTGDARLSLEREPAQSFDLLALDAFNSDAVPVHLLTEEAFAVYGRHLKPDGVLAVHVSNLNVDLEPVVLNLACHSNYEVAIVDYPAPRDQPWILRSVWMLLSHRKEIIKSSTMRTAARPAETDPAKIPLWTDDFASLFQILRSQKKPQIDPVFSEAQSRLANNLCQQGDFAGAITNYRLALKSHPDLPELNNNLAWLLTTCPDGHVRNGAQAVAYAEHACALTQYIVTPMVGTLAAAYAEAGRFDDAIAMAQKACTQASESGRQDLLKRNQELLILYRQHLPYHEVPAPGQPPPATGAE